MLKCSRKNSSVYIALVTPNSYSKILPCISLCFRKGYWLTLRWSWCSSLSSTLPLLITFPESLADWLLGSFSQQEALEIRKRRARISCLLHSLLWEAWLYPVPWDSPSLCGFSSTHPPQPHLWLFPTSPSQITQFSGSILSFAICVPLAPGAGWGFQCC